MEIRDSRKPASRHLERFGFASFAPFVSVLALLAAAGCGAPGEPVPPSPPIPAAVTDLAAHQDEDGVELTFILPIKTVAG
ncbi:MAG: hypothetical protein ACREIW_04860, partial [Chthoniobacterales bacterium]